MKRVPRYFVIGKMYGYTDKEILRCTPRKLMTLLDADNELHGRKKKKVTIDDVIPI